MNNVTSTVETLPVVEFGTDLHVTGANAMLNYIDQLPEETINEIAAKFLKAKELENSGEQAKKIRTSMGILLEQLGVVHESRITVGNRTYTFKLNEGTSSGVTAAAITNFKNRYHRVSWVGRMLDHFIAAEKKSYVKRSLTLG